MNYKLGNKFYTDICSHYETIDHYDVLLDDRYTYFYENSTYYFCEEQCEMTDVYPETSEIFCECLNKNNTLDSVDFVKYVIEEQRFKRSRNFSEISRYYIWFSIFILYKEKT